jgi:uncharacterized Zn-finger protein
MQNVQYHLGSHIGLDKGSIPSVSSFINLLSTRTDPLTNGEHQVISLMYSLHSLMASVGSNV